MIKRPKVEFGIIETIVGLVTLPTASFHLQKFGHVSNRRNCLSDPKFVHNWNTLPKKKRLAPDFLAFCPKRKQFSNHPFSGAIAVSFRCCISLTPIYQKVYSHFCSKLMCMNLEKFHHAGHVLVTFWTSWIVSMSQWPRWRTTSWEFLGCFCCGCVGQKKTGCLRWGDWYDMLRWYCYDFLTSRLWG